MMRINNRGITLWELLAVIVILGVLTAVLAPSITGIINNTKKDAHIANAYEVAAAAKLYVIKTNLDDTNNKPSVQELINAGYIDQKEFLQSDPDGQYNPETSKVEIVTENESLIIKVYLDGSKYDVEQVVGGIGNNEAVDYTTLTRDNVVKDS